MNHGTRRTIGLLLVLIGISVATTCIILALRDLGGLYQGAMNDPLGQPDAAETDTSRRMLTLVAIGAAGAIPAIPGSFMLRRSRRT